jgi:hypothetical protein
MKYNYQKELIYLYFKRKNQRSVRIQRLITDLTERTINYNFNCSKVLRNFSLEESSNTLEQVKI